MSGSPLFAPTVRLPASRLAGRAPGRWLANLRHLSLDIVLGVAAAASFAVAATGATMPLLWWLLLPLATWVVYSADHLLDSRRTGAGSQQSRHRFYHRRFRGLAGATLVLLAAGAMAGLVLLPAALRLPSLLAGSAAALHLVLAQGASRIFVKEFSAAAIYVGAIWFGPVLLAPDAPRVVFALAALHLIAALGNLIAFALFEERSDEIDGHASIVRSWGRRRARRLLGALTVLGVCGVLLVALHGPAPTSAASLALLVLLVLIATPAVMVIRPGFFGAHERYRVVGDLAFALMALPFLLFFL